MKTKRLIGTLTLGLGQTLAVVCRRRVGGPEALSLDGVGEAKSEG